jgi:hypothetical protein
VVVPAACVVPLAVLVVVLVAGDALVPLQGSVRLDDWGHTIDLSGMQPPVMWLTPSTSNT